MTGPAGPASVAVLGAGTIGLGAAIRLAAHGSSVTVVTRRTQAADEVPATIGQRCEQLRALGALTDEQTASVRGNLAASVGLPAGSSFDLILESIGEQLDAKRAILAAAEPSLAPGGVLATTTSSLSVEELAGAVRSPARFAAWHWFHPAELVELVEIVPGLATAPDVVISLTRWSTAIEKTPVVLRRDVPGFVANRLQYALLREAYALTESGVCDRADVDAAVTSGLGARWAAVGPFESMDLAGLDVHATVAETLFPALSVATEVPDSLRDLRAGGARGARAGDGLRGHYDPARLRELEHRRDQTLTALRETA